MSPYNLLYDEFNERGDKVKLLTILVSIYEPSTGSIVTRHLDTISIVDFTAIGIFSGIKGCLESHSSFNHLLSFTSDTCNAMKGVRGGVIAQLKSVQPNIIHVDCIYHLVSLCVKAAVKTLPLRVDKWTFIITSITSLTELCHFRNICRVLFY